MLFEANKAWGLGFSVLWLVVMSFVWLDFGAVAPFWDENYHICSAEKYLGGVMFMEPHPPLGKQLLALGGWFDSSRDAVGKVSFYRTDHISELPTGYSLSGMRFASAIAGLMGCIFLIALFNEIFRNVAISLGFASLYAFDNGLVVHCRAAMLEGFQLMFMIASLWLFVRLMLRARSISLGMYCMLALCVGLAIAVKINSAVLLVVFPILWCREHWDLINEKRVRPLLRAFAVKAGVSCAVIAFALAVPFYVHFGLGQRIEGGRAYAASPEYRRIISEGETWNPRHFGVMLRDNLAYMRDYQRGVPSLDVTKPGENGSHPLNWLIGGRAISYRWDREGAFIRHIYLVLNPVGLLVGLVALGLSLALIVAIAVFDHRPTASPMVALIFSFSGLYVLYMVAVLRSDRVFYLYHYFIPLIFTWVLAAALFSYLFSDALATGDRWIRCGLAVLLIQLLLAFYFFSPLTYHQPLDIVEFSSRSWLKIWGMRHAY